MPPMRIPVHRPAGTAIKQAREKLANRARVGTTADRGYDYQWQKISKLWLQRHPLCEFCMARGRRTPATETDHRDGNAWNRDSTNLRSTCKPCHSRRTATDQSFGRRLPTSNK